MTASLTHGRALRVAQGSARGLLHHHRGHCLGSQPTEVVIADAACEGDAIRAAIAVNGPRVAIPSTPTCAQG